MIPYDVSLADVEYYWAGSLLLWERKGVYIPVTLRVRPESDGFPIALHTSDTNAHVVNISIQTLIEKCMVHFPIMGYADMDGVPVYISPKAGQGKLKGIDLNLVSVYVPVNIREMASEGIRTLGDKLSEAIVRGKAASVPAADQARRERYLRLYDAAGHTRGTAATLGYMQLFSINKKQMHRIIAQAINNRYMPITDAMAYLKEKGIVGVSLSTNCCVINSITGVRTLYHKLTPVGELVNNDTVRIYPHIRTPMVYCLRSVLPFKSVIQ